MFKYMPIVLFVLFSCTQQNSEVTTALVPEKIEVESPDIKLEVEGLSEGEYVALVGNYLGENYLIDSTRVQENGVIHFTHEVPYNQGLAFALLENDAAIEMLITEDQTFSLETSFAAIDDDMKVEGSIDNELFYKTLQLEKSNGKEIIAINQQLYDSIEDRSTLETELQIKIDERYAFYENLEKNYPNSFYTKYKIAAQNPDMRTYDRQAEKLSLEAYKSVFKNKFWDEVDFSDERLLSTPVIRNKLEYFINELVDEKSDSIVKYANQLIDSVLEYPVYYKFFSNWMLKKYEPVKSNLMDAEAVYVNIVNRYFTKDRATWVDSMTIYGFQQKAYAMAGSLRGKQGRDVKGRDINGVVHSIYGQSSDYVLLYVFNPKCELCKYETPKLVERYAAWKAKGIEIIAVATDADKEELSDYIKKQHIKFPVISDPNNRLLYPNYYVDKTPELYLLNESRTIIGKNLQTEMVDGVVEYHKSNSLNNIL